MDFNTIIADKQFDLKIKVQELEEQIDQLEELEDEVQQEIDDAAMEVSDFRRERTTDAFNNIINKLEAAGFTSDETDEMINEGELQDEIRMSEDMF